MTDRDQDRRSSSDDAYGRNAPRSEPEGDPMSELARLIGQTDPFANFGRANPSHPTRRTPAIEPAPESYAARERSADETPPSSGPSWMKHRPLQNRPPVPTPPPVEAPSVEDEPDINATPHPLHRYAAQQQDLPDHASPSFVSDPEPYQDDLYRQDATASHQPQPHDDRYDDVLFGSPEPVHAPDHAEQSGFTPGYASDGYDDPDAYAEPQQKPRRKGFVTVAAVMALAVVGTGGAYAYRNYVSTSRSGEPPVIKADTAPIKVVPPTNSSDANGKLIQDRLAAGNGMEKLVSREETPVDPRDPSKAGPRVIFPPLNANGAPTSAAAIPAAKPLTSSQTAPGDEPRKIRTFAVKGDQADVAGVPVARPAPRPSNNAATTAKPPAAANVGNNAPVLLSPQSTGTTEPRARIEATTPTQSPAAATGNFFVQVASQRNETDALASYKALQGKYPAVLGSRSAQIKRADLGEKGTYYRAVIGPFSSSEDATSVCGNLKTAGGQCVVQRN